MSFLAPGWIGLAALASLAVVAIHLIAWRLPRSVVLPTARFVPDEPARRAARTIRPADLALLVLRVTVLMAGGLAMARPVIQASPRGSATVVALARVGSTGDTTTLRDSVRGIPRSGRTVFVIFDTTASVIADEDAAIAEAARGDAGTSLSVGLLAAIREARRLEQDYDTVRVTLVAPFTRRSFDNATRSIREAWPDSIRTIRVRLGAPVAVGSKVEIDADDSDPVVAGIRLAQSNGLIRGNVRVVRGRLTSERADSGIVVVVWPKAAPDAQSRTDAIHAGGVTAIGYFTQTAPGDSGRVIARWVNGAPAARELARENGCVRIVGFDVPDVGDLVLTPSFQHLAAEVLSPCGGDRGIDLATDSLVAALVAPAADPSVPKLPDVGARDRLAAILMLVAVLLGILELRIRSRTRPALVEQGA